VIVKEKNNKYNTMGAGAHSKITAEQNAKNDRKEGTPGSSRIRNNQIAPSLQTIVSAVLLPYD